MAVGAFVEILASIGRHGLFFGETAERAGNHRLKNHVVGWWHFVFLQKPYPVMQTKSTSAGIRKVSREGIRAVKPMAPSVITSSGVKQHSALTIVPTMPTFNQFITTPLSEDWNKCSGRT